MPKAASSVKLEVTDAEQTNHHPALKYAAGFQRASQGIAEAESALNEGERSDGSIDKQTKTYGLQCTIASLEEISALTRSYARTSEYLTSIRETEDREYTIFGHKDFRFWAEICAEELDKASRSLGCVGERIAKTIRDWTRTPEEASTLGLQCDAAARMLKLKASR